MAVVVAEESSAYVAHFFGMPRTRNSSTSPGPDPALRAVYDHGFPPIAARDSHTLILGSLPGRRSLELQQYYAHPQNAFWRLVGRIFDVDVLPPYSQRVDVLTRHGIALWDVLATAERPGSLDSSIVRASELANDFAMFFDDHPGLRRVFFNGRKAEELYRRNVLPKLGPGHAGIRYESLPSTSPAHAGMTFAQKLVRWRRIARRPE